MLKRFEVKNYKNFQEKIMIDFSNVDGYQFSTDCITDQLISKMIIYGRNATGKTNFGKALLDIRDNLALVRFIRSQEGNYLNADSTEGYAEFAYTFLFDGDELIYKYRKRSETNLLDEELLLNGIRCFYFNFDSLDADFSNLKYLEADTVIVERYMKSMVLPEESEDSVSMLPFLRWLINNTALPGDSVLLKLDDFIKRMAMITVGSSMMNGFRRMNDLFLEMLTDNDALKDFEEFLNIMGIACSLVIKQLPDGQKQLYFKHEQLLPFYENASSGTIALTNLYRRLEMGKSASVMYLDEFDAFYHYEMSENMIKFFKKKFPQCQIIMTTHNTNLMTNRFMRPDCLFILSGSGNLTALSNATERELREGHNLEKMYISGEFERYE